MCSKKKKLNHGQSALPDDYITNYPYHLPYKKSVLHHYAGGGAQDKCLYLRPTIEICE